MHMKCWHCATPLIWGGDHDTDEDSTEYSMVTNLSCPECNAHVFVYLPKDQMQPRVGTTTQEIHTINNYDPIKECNYYGCKASEKFKRSLRKG